MSSNGQVLIFFLNLPLAIVVLLVSFSQVPESRCEEEGKLLDILGALLVTIGLGSDVYSLIKAQHVGFADPVVLGCIIGGLI